MLKKFLQDETGAELAEYAVGVALLVAIGIVVYKVLGDAVNDSNSITRQQHQDRKISVKSAHTNGSQLAFSWLPSSISFSRKVNIMNLKKSFLTLLKDEQGAELAEYAVGVALLVAIGIVVYKVLGDSNQRQPKRNSSKGRAMR